MKSQKSVKFLIGHFSVCPLVREMKNCGHLWRQVDSKTAISTLRKRREAKWRGPGAGAGDSSAVREASRGIKASYGANPCPLCPRASRATAVAGTWPCCACPGHRSRQGARIPATTRGGRAGGPALGRPPLAGGLTRRFRPGRSGRTGPCAEPGAGLAWAGQRHSRDGVVVPQFFSEKLGGKSSGIVPNSSGLRHTQEFRGLIPEYSVL
jgi:hypothetical protein